MTDDGQETSQSPRRRRRGHPALISADDVRLFSRHAAYEAAMMTLLVFCAVSVTRWAVGVSAFSRWLGSIHAQLAVVGATVGVVLGLLIISPPGRASGGHMNPAITLAMWRYRIFPGAALAFYIPAQLAGSLLGALLAHLAWGAAVSHVAGLLRRSATGTRLVVRGECSPSKWSIRRRSC